MALLRARLLDAERRQKEQEEARERRSQVGTGHRSEKIRTYNFSQNRVSDHRIGKTLRNLPRILEGDLDGLIDALIADDQMRQLEGQAT
ncbi:Peptide chain release factor 1 [subsurface metagenome]